MPTSALDTAFPRTGSTDLDVNSGPNIAITPNSAPTEDIQDKLFDYQRSRPHLERMVRDWTFEVAETEQRRKERKVDVNVESLRQKGDLDEDETLIPIRVIDSNITKEQPPFINYLKNSRRIAIFRSLSDPQQDCDLLEQDFTRVATYTNWETPIFKCLDGAQAHGWDAVEVVLDTNKPGNFAIEHIGHDKLFFPMSTVDFQAAPRVSRAYDVTLTQLQEWITKYGFDSAQVGTIKAGLKDTTKETETIRIHKLYFKKGDCVYTAWYCLLHGCSDWLKKPIQFYCGIDTPSQMGGWQPKEMDMIPIFLLPYRVTEEQKIVETKGRGFLDCYKQEAQTAVWSAFINALTRASVTCASVAQEDGSGSSLKEYENAKLTSGRIFNKPLSFWAHPYPDPIVLRTLEFAESQNSAENNQVDFAVMNRQDSRKTAKEIGAAQQQQSLLNSVQLTLFSTFVRQVYSFAWLIVQSQALQNKIRFMQVQKQQPMMNPLAPGIPMQDPQTGQPMMQSIWTNDTSIISQMFDIRAAGDTDVIAKDEIIQKMRTDFQLMMQTPLKDQFLLDYVKLSYPERADKYAQILGQTGQMQMMQSLIARLSTMLQGVLKDAPQVVQQLPQQQQSDLMQTIQEAAQLSNQPSTAQPQ